MPGISLSWFFSLKSDFGTDYVVEMLIIVKKQYDCLLRCNNY